MQKTILITGSTDGIGIETARTLLTQGHHILLHGRNPTKLQDAETALQSMAGQGTVDTFLADLSHLSEVKMLADTVAQKYGNLDVLINNAGVYRTSHPLTKDGLDVRFVVNAIAPYLLTQLLLPILTTSGRVVNVSSAAQSPVDLKALAEYVALADDVAYAQSKLALTMWSRHMALALGDSGPMIIAVNPGSLLGTKMVKDAYGIAGGDVGMGADILSRAAVSEEFATTSGQYYDNDSESFASPHPDALDQSKMDEVVAVIANLLSRLN
ncbi:MAG: SDR family NAD(P)-dependent oxidoreductase [Pseudomonadota bacterium]